MFFLTLFFAPLIISTAQGIDNQPQNTELAWLREIKQRQEDMKRSLYEHSASLRQLTQVLELLQQQVTASNARIATFETALNALQTRVAQMATMNSRLSSVEAESTNLKNSLSNTVEKFNYLQNTTQLSCSRIAGLEARVKNLQACADCANKRMGYCPNLNWVSCRHCY